MPITKSAKKSIRQNKRRRVINLKRKKALKTTLKEVKLLISENKLKEAKEMMPKVQRVLDKSAKMHTIKENKARRTKSRIEKSISNIK